MPNTYGVGVRGGTGTVIGGLDSGAGNVISGNTYYGYGEGVELSASGLLVQGNLIGLDATGSAKNMSLWAHIRRLDDSTTRRHDRRQAGSAASHTPMATDADYPAR